VDSESAREAKNKGALAIASETNENIVNLEQDQ
jgi:hypothetical protein